MGAGVYVVYPEFFLRLFHRARLSHDENFYKDGASC